MRRINKYFKRFKYKLLKLVSRRISVQMLIVLILAITIPLSILGMLLIKTSQDAIRASVLRSHQELAIRAASEVDLFIQQPKDLLISTASILGVIPADAFSQETVLVELALNNPIFSKIYSLNKDGMEIATSELGSQLKDRTDEPGFSKALAEEFYMSNVYIQDNRTPYVKMAMPIKRQGEVNGVLLAELNLRGMWDIVDRIKLNKTGMAFVVSEKGILIAHPDKKRVLTNESIPSDKTIKSVYKGQINSFALIPDLGWRVVVTQSANEAFSFSRIMKTQSWVLIILSELLAIVVSILLAKALVKPIKALAETTKQVARGRLDEYISFKRRDELGDLMRAFNNMLKKLREAKASERLSIIGMAATAIVHELKNSLVMVNTFVGLFPQRHKDKRFVERFARTVPQELERWKAMLQDLSDFSRGEKIDLPLAEVDIAGLIKDIHYLIEEMAAQSNIKLDVNIEEELPCILGNSQKLKQVFLNLANNAIEAMPDGGSLILSAGMVNGKSIQKSKCIEIRVKDTGTGIPPQSLERIFEPFHTTKSNGMGLGLAISRNIIQRHGGDIEVESKPNQGTTFVVKLPIRNHPTPEVDKVYENSDTDRIRKQG